MSGRKTYGLFGSIEKKSMNERSICKNIEIGKIKKHFKENDFEIPEYQRDLDEDKVDEMFQKINTSVDDLIIFSNQVNPIQIATIQIEDNKYKHIVIDGQHRLHALVMLPNKFNKILFTFHLQICENEMEAIEKFKTCIKGNDTNYLIDSNTLTPYFKESVPYRFKKILRDAFSYLLPSDVLNRKKHGFNVPIDQWLRNEWAGLVNETFSGASALSRLGFLHKDSHDTALKMVKDKKRLNGHTIFSYIMLNRWLEENFI